MRGSAFLSAAFLATTLCACVSTSQQLHGDFANVDWIQASTGKFDGATVRWGGVVTGTRMIDSGNCIEVGAYMLDRWTFRPTGLSPDAYKKKDSIRPAYYHGLTRYASPRFLACGDSILDKSTYYPGAVVTFTGSIQRPFVFEAEYDSCRVNQQDRAQADYTGTIHVVDDQRCAVWLPVLKVAQAHAWIEPPRDGRLDWANER